MEENKEQQRARAKAYWQTYYAKNKQTLRQKRREYAEAHREANKEKQKIYMSLYYQKNKQAIKEKRTKQPLVGSPPESPVVLESTIIVSRGNHLVTFN